MTISLTLSNICQFIFIYICVLGILITWRIKPINSINYLLILVCCSMGFNLLEELNITRSWHLITPVFLLAQGPAFYLFVKKLIDDKTLFCQKDLIHFVPSIIAIPFTMWPQTIIAIGTISQFIYAAITFLLIHQYHHIIFANRADAETLKIHWIGYVLSSFLILGVIDLIRLNMQPYIVIQLNLFGQFITTLFSLLLVTFLLIKLLEKPEIFSDFTKKKQHINNDVDNTLINDQTLAQSIEKSIYESLEILIIEKELFKQPRLSLADLSAETGLLERDISRAINLISKMNFCEFINTLRIQMVVNYLKTSQDSILDIALASGFNSKSSFNTVFKKQMHMTPSQYIKNNR